ncbi:MAG: NAD-dependent epimerase/dehydratase family protein [Legionellaceae bacterium]|nr:NAD-dependent epimerase/dehydratase family protein [Legionellaceae bacterium]
MEKKTVLVTGANGFVAKNLIVHLNRMSNIEVIKFSREDSIISLKKKVGEVDFIFHLAAANRPKLEEAFRVENFELTQVLCEALVSAGRKVPIFFSSSTQAEQDNAYGVSKRMAEEAIEAYSASVGVACYIYRLPNLFGKWCKPNYNSAIATFCHNITRDLPITVDDRSKKLSLLYIDDLVDACIQLLTEMPASNDKPSLDNDVHEISLGALSDMLHAFRDSRETLITEQVGSGLTRKLYSTYVSYLPVEKFNYYLQTHADPRGRFVEMLKTKDSGQFSFFTAGPGITRGGHYHHTKTEKFLVVKGEACFRFKQIVTNEVFEIYTSGETPQVVETVPGWSHDITNVGTEEFIVMLWANEIFDKDKPDTFSDVFPEYQKAPVIKESSSS